MKMDIEIKRTAKTLDERHCASPGSPACVPGFPDLVRGQCPVDDPQYPAHHRWAGREQSKTLCVLLSKLVLE